jgi:small GTP-binding protein
MKAVIVGTAGHIDHGKSALVRALTGTDPDRLEEEKRRGITIDIGFANLDLAGPSGDPIRLGFVDVPGHERFVRNMLAGIGGIDLVLLVIAADESVKPQTREHFDICRLLSVQRGITVLTKTDLVDPDTLEVMRMEIDQYLRGSFLDPANSPIVAVSARTGAGLDDLKRELARLAANTPAKDAAAAFRLPIDRVFSMKGFGTVITGTQISGTVRKDEELEVHPGGRRLRVRSIQVHGTSAEKAVAGQRTALNLVGAETSDLARGMTLTAPGVFRSTRNISVEVNLLPSAKLMRNGARVHLHVFTAETIAEVQLLDTKHLAPGQSALARFKLDDPAMLLPGDRFIIRQFSPVITIGGGMVLDALDPARRRQRSPVTSRFLFAHDFTSHGNARLANGSRQGTTSVVPATPASPITQADFSPRTSRESDVNHTDAPPVLEETSELRPVTPRSTRAAQHLAFLHALDTSDARAILLARIEHHGGDGLPLAEAVAETGWLRSRVEAVAAELVQAGKLLRLADLLISTATVAKLKEALKATLDAFHHANPLVAGISREELREKLGIGAEVYRGIEESLIGDRQLEAADELIRAAGRGVVLRSEEAESKNQIEAAFATAGLKVPLLKDVLSSLPIDKARAQKIVTLLLRDRVLVKVGDELVFHRDALDGLRKLVMAHKTKSPKLNVTAFKDLIGVSRKYAIPLLEYLDRERVTRRVGDERIIL